MSFANRTNRGIFNTKEDNQASNIFGARGMTITHIPKAKILTTKLSLIDRVKKQLLHRFERKSAALIWPHNYEIQLMPTHRPKVDAATLRKDLRLANMVGVTSTSALGSSGRYWFANKATREKLSQTSSNLG
jgi:hypothetical protein